MDRPLAFENKDLNASLIPVDRQDTGEALKDYSRDFHDVSVYFRDLTDKAIQHIRKADVVFGCVAWLTHYRIMEALASLKFGASIVVQKEDFLKPDINPMSDWVATLRKKYDAITCSLCRFELPDPVGSMSMNCDPEIEGVRCVGECNVSRKPSFPRMHNKFLVFAEATRVSSRKGPTGVKIIPYAVWTGSLNFSLSSSLSFENAVVLYNSKVAKQYFREFCQILALSEPLNWNSEWMQPEWRIGT